jgi:hypothetical protein
VKIEHVYVIGSPHDLRYTQCCVASIRRWYPDIPISLLKDESNGAYSTRELEEAWDVAVFDGGHPLPGRGWAKLEPMFRPGRQRCLILDSDVVFLGRVIEPLEALDADFVVESAGGWAGSTGRDYFDLVALKEFDPEFVFPGYTFNCGQLVATTGILRRADFEPLVRFGEIRCQPPRTDRLRTMVHWAGKKWKILRLMRNGGLLRHFEAYYYSRIPGGRRRRLWRSAQLLSRILTRQESGRVRWNSVRSSA